MWQTELTQSLDKRMTDRTRRLPILNRVCTRLMILATAQEDDVRAAALRLLGDNIRHMRTAASDQGNVHGGTGQCCNVAAVVCVDSRHDRSCGLFLRVVLHDEAVGVVHVGKVEGRAGVARLWVEAKISRDDPKNDGGTYIEEDGQATSDWERLYEDIVEYIVNDETAIGVVNWAKSWIEYTIKA